MAERKVSNEMKVEMFRMRLEGHTLQQIGDAYGITRERVRQLLEAPKTDKRSALETIIYPNLYKWLLDNEETLTHLAKSIGVAPSNFILFATGKRDVRFTVTTINKLLKITNMTFEQLFLVKEK